MEKIKLLDGDIIEIHMCGGYSLQSLWALKFMAEESDKAIFPCLYMFGTFECSFLMQLLVKLSKAI